MKKFVSAPSNSQTVINYILLNFLLSGICTSMMRGAIALYSGSFEENVRYIIIFILLSTVGQIPLGIAADAFSNRHLLVQNSVMLVLIGFLFPQRFGLVFRVIIAGIGYALFCASAGASLLSRTDSRKITGYAFFSSFCGISSAVMMTRPIIGYPMIIVAMFVACAGDRKGVEYQNLIEADEQKCQIACRTAKGKRSMKSILPAVLLLTVGSYCLYFVYIDNFLFFDLGKNYGRAVTAAVFCIGRTFGGAVIKKINPIYSGAFGAVLSAALLIFGRASGSRTVMLLAAVFLGFAFSGYVSLMRETLGRRHSGIGVGLLSAPAALAYFSSQPYYGMLLPINGAFRVIVLFAVSLLPFVYSFFNSFSAKSKKR